MNHPIPYYDAHLGDYDAMVGDDHDYCCGGDDCRDVNVAKDATCAASPCSRYDHDCPGDDRQP